MRGRGKLKGQEAWGPVCTRGAAQRAKPKFEPLGLNIGGISGERSERPGGNMLNATERPIEGLGALGPNMHEGERFSARNRNSSRSGSISVESVKSGQQTAAGGHRMRVRGCLKSRGAWGPLCTRGGADLAIYPSISSPSTISSLLTHHLNKAPSGARPCWKPAATYDRPACKDRINLQNVSIMLPAA